MGGGVSILSPQHGVLGGRMSERQTATDADVKPTPKPSSHVPLCVCMCV